MVNGFEYAWEDINVIIEGRAIPLTGCVAVDYETKKDHTNIYASGDKPVAMGRGKKEFSASIKLLQSDIEAMQSAMPAGKDITNRTPFIITVAYAPEVGIPTVDQLLFCRIASVKKGMKTGDPNQEIELPLVVGDIKYNI